MTNNEERKIQAETLVLASPVILIHHPTPARTNGTPAAHHDPIQHFHDHTKASHPRARKTLRTEKKLYAWTGLSKDNRNRTDHANHGEGDIPPMGITSVHPYEQRHSVSVGHMDQGMLRGEKPTRPSPPTTPKPNLPSHEIKILRLYPMRLHYIILTQYLTNINMSLAMKVDATQQQ
uniref:Uncharacterized protein n=1 Tax=Timema douglasi TaxID=61478 RepID=A0A7R8VNT2_TIMDO|nr:unnamed protein product [Timema douglasi]